MNRFKKKNGQELLNASVAKTSPDVIKDNGNHESLKSESWGINIYNLFSAGLVGNVSRKEKHYRFGYWILAFSGISYLSCETVKYALLRSKTMNDADAVNFDVGIKEAKRVTPEADLNAKNPCTHQDAEYLCNRIPKDWKHRDVMCAAIYLAMETGCRCISIVHLSKDNITYLENGGAKITFNYGKGHRMWGHTITLSNLSKAIPFVKKIGGFTGATTVLSEDALSRRFKSCCVRAGIEKSFFCFHSLRSGFLASAYINGDGSQSVIEQTAIIAGWKREYFVLFDFIFIFIFIFIFLFLCVCVLVVLCFIIFFFLTLIYQLYLLSPPPLFIPLS